MDRGERIYRDWEIAGSPRNIFKYSLVKFDVVVKHSWNFGDASLPDSY